MSNNLTRRGLLKTLSLAGIGVSVIKPNQLLASEQISAEPFSPSQTDKPKTPVKVIVVGAGGRGWNAYSS